MSIGLISVVIPTYNYGRFVAEAVESVLAQTYAEVETIVVDDGSTDDTRERLAPYMGRLRYIPQENRGLSAARNRGIEASKGDWVAFLDSDDVWHPRKLEIQADCLGRNPGIDLLAADSVPGQRVDWGKVALPEAPGVLDITRVDLLYKTMFGSCGVLVRRRCFDDVGRFDVALRSAEDRDMWIRIAARFRVAKLEAPLWLYRTHGSGMSTVAGRMEENELRVLAKAFRESGPATSRLLRLRSYSRAYCSSAMRHQAAGEDLIALGRLGRSLRAWPFPLAYDPGSRGPRLLRPRMLAVILLRMVGLRRPTRRGRGHGV